MYQICPLKRSGCTNFQFMGKKLPLKVTYMGDLADENITCKMDRVWYASDEMVFFERSYRHGEMV